MKGILKELQGKQNARGQWVGHPCFMLCHVEQVTAIQAEVNLGQIFDPVNFLLVKVKSSFLVVVKHQAANEG
jgi:hypothetical protein